MISSPTSSYFFFFLVAFLTISYQNPSQRNPGASSFLFSSSKDAGGRNVASRSFAEIFHFAFLELVSFLFRIHFALRPFGFWFHFDWFPFGLSFPKRCKDRLPKTAGKKTANLHYMEYAILIRGTFRGPLGEIPNSILLAISRIRIPLAQQTKQALNEKRSKEKRRKRIACAAR